MRKFIVAFDGLRYSESAQQYAITLAGQNGAHLVGVFLDDFMVRSYHIYDLVTENDNYIARQRQLDAKDKKRRDESVEMFEKACQRAGLHYTIHRDKSVAMQELLTESIFADLLIIDSNETVSGYPEHTPTEFIRELLVRTQCPVLVVPDHYKPFDSLTLLYDGEPSSVYAIKMFSYTLSSMKQLATEVITVKAADEDSHLPDGRLLKEFMKRHFSQAKYTVLKGYPEPAIIDYLKQHPASRLVVLGAYRRNMVSRLLRPSIANAFMKQLHLPLYIAHNK